jgi:pyruvate dehydrogenase E1 component alpha subunit
MAVSRVDGNDVEQVFGAVDRAVEQARRGDGPTLIECDTYRQRGHSRSDPGLYRPAAEVTYWLDRDPLRLLCRRLISLGRLDDAVDAKIQAEARRRVDLAETTARASGALQDDLAAYVYA